MDNDKLEHILMKQMGIIHRYLLKMGASKEDAEDIVQDTVCKAIEYVYSLEKEKISSWLFKVSINRFYKLHNRNKRIQIDLDDETISNLSSVDTVESMVLNSERKENVQKILDSLKESYRNLIILKYLMDLSYREIGNLLDLDEDKVKTYLYRARNKFRELWEETNNGI